MGKKKRYTEEDLELAMAQGYEKGVLTERQRQEEVSLSLRQMATATITDSQGTHTQAPLHEDFEAATSVIRDWVNHRGVPTETLEVQLRAALGWLEGLDRPSHVSEVEPDETTMAVRESVAQEAERIVNGNRMESYGKASVSFKRIAELWETTLRGYGLLAPDAQITPEHVAILMVQQKISRQISRHGRDNLVDIIGYTLCLENVLEESGG